MRRCKIETSRQWEAVDVAKTSRRILEDQKVISILTSAKSQIAINAHASSLSRACMMIAMISTTTNASLRAQAGAEAWGVAEVATFPGRRTRSFNAQAIRNQVHQSMMRSLKWRLMKKVSSSSRPNQTSKDGVTTSLTKWIRPRWSKWEKPMVSNLFLWRKSKLQMLSTMIHERLLASWELLCGLGMRCSWVKPSTLQEH